MFPMQRTREPAGAAARRFGRTDAAVRIGHLQEVARCQEGPVLIFWPRTPRRTFLPADAVPLRPDGANEPREGDYEEEDGDDDDDDEEEEEEELSGVEESRRALFRDSGYKGFTGWTRGARTDYNTHSARLKKANSTIMRQI